MIKRIIYVFLAHENSEGLAYAFEETFEHYEFGDLDLIELQTIENLLTELKDAKILQKHCLEEISNYHKALKKEIKAREEDYF